MDIVRRSPEYERLLVAVRDAHDRAFLRYLKYRDQDGRDEREMDLITPAESRYLATSVEDSV